MSFEFLILKLCPDRDFLYFYLLCHSITGSYKKYSLSRDQVASCEVKCTAFAAALSQD